MNNLLVFRFANTFVESFWNRNYIASVQITMAEDFGVQGRGAFYDETGAIRDVIQNHLFQVLSNLAMEPPVRADSESIRDEKVKVLKAIPPIEEKHLVRGQFRGYRDEPGVAKGSQTQFLALERSSLLHSSRQMPARDVYRNCWPVPQTSHIDTCQCSDREPSAAPAQSRNDHCHGDDGDVPG